MASLSDSILESLLPGGLRKGSRSRSCVEQFISCSKDLFMSFILARSLSQADLLYCSLLPSSSNLFAPVFASLSFLNPLVGTRWIRGGWRVEDWVGDVDCWTSILHICGERDINAIVLSLLWRLHLVSLFCAGVLNLIEWRRDSLGHGGIPNAR